MENKRPNFKKAVVKTEDYLNDGTTYTIHGWMIKRLKLKGNEKDIFAIIHGFSQNKNGYFYGSKAYLAKFASCDVSTVKAVLASLVKKGLITRYGEEYTGSKQRVYYVSNVDPEKIINEEHSLETYKKIKEEYEKNAKEYGGEITPGENSPGNSGIIPRAGEENRHNIINNNNINNKYVVVDEQRFINAIKLERARILEAYRTDEYSSKAIQYAIDSFNCFGTDQIAFINKFSDSDYNQLFKVAFSLVRDDIETKNIVNKKAFFSNEIKKHIKNVKKMEEKHNDTNDKHK